MIDLPPLPFITPTTGSLPPNLSAESSPLTATVQILSLPEKLAEITRPIQINGALVSEVSNLTVTLRTPAGDMSLALPPSTDGKPNSIVEQLTSLVQNQKPVSLTIQPDGASLRASLLVPPSSLLASPSRLSHLSPTKPAEAPGQPSTFTPGKIFTAIVLSADEKNDFGFFTSKASPPLQAENAILSSLGSNLQGKLSQAFLSIKSQVASTLGFTAVPEDETTQTLQPRPEPLAPRSETFSAKPGTELRFKISSIEPNSSPPSKELPSLSGNSVRATVVAKGTDGQLILNTGKTTLFARESADLPLGSQITLTLLPAEPETGLILSPEKALELPALRRLMASLGQIDPVLAMNVLHNRIPQPNKTLPTTLLLLFNFLQDGNAKAWLGEAAIGRLGNAKKAELVAKLLEDLQQGFSQTRDATVGEWRSFPLPLYNDHQFQLIHFYVRREGERHSPSSASGSAGAGQTRFLINIHMTHLGALQMDGLSQKKKLDLVIRSERGLPDGLPRDLRALYIKTIDALGLSGTLSFQTGHQNWILMQREKTAPVTM